MKTILMVLLLSVVAASAGQYGAPNYRRVNGQLYDVYHSALWRTQMVEQVALKQGVMVGVTFTNVPLGSGLSGYFKRIYGPKVALTNYQDALPAIVPKPGVPGRMKRSAGGPASHTWSMCVGKFEYEGETMPLWDCGRRAEEP